MIEPEPETHGKTGVSKDDLIMLRKRVDDGRDRHRTDQSDNKRVEPPVVGIDGDRNASDQRDQEDGSRRAEGDGYSTTDLP